MTTQDIQSLIDGLKTYTEERFPEPQDDFSSVIGNLEDAISEQKELEQEELNEGDNL